MVTNDGSMFHAKGFYEAYYMGVDTVSNEAPPVLRVKDGVNGDVSITDGYSLTGVGVRN